MPNDDRQQYQETVRERPRRNGWKVATLVLFISTVVFATTTLLAYNHIINPLVAKPTLIATQAPQQTTTGPAPTSASAPSSMSTVQPSAPVADGVIQENITLTCNGCNDPIRVTINTVQIDNANGRMIWDNTLKDVTGSNLGYSFNEYNLQANASQTQIPATFSQANSNLVSNVPADIQGIFAFVPSHNVTYTLIVILGWSNGNPASTTFDPVKITF